MDGASYTKRLACGNCQRKKLKCDRVVPCASCKVRGLQSQCYQDASRRHRAEPTASTSSAVHRDTSPIADIQANLAKVTTALQAQQHTIDSLITQLQGNVKEQRQSLDPSHWMDEVIQALPSQKDCTILLDFCSTQIRMLDLPLHQSQLLETLNRLRRRAAVSKIEVAFLLVVLADSILMMPALHPHRYRLSSSFLEADHSKWMVLADRLKSQGRFHHSTQRVDWQAFTREVISEIMLEVGFIIYLNHSDRADELWDVLGVAIRKGASISLFDERHALWQGLGEEEKVERRRLALSIAVIDAWTSTNRMRPLGISLTSIHLDFQESNLCRAGVAPLIGEHDPRQLATIHNCHSFILNFNEKDAATRYKEAASLCQEIKLTTEAILRSLDVTVPLEILPSYISSVPDDQKAQLLICVSTASYSACMVTRRFLTDSDAPAELRFISLQHAQNILATVPIVTAIAQQKRVPINPSWNAPQLLCAASAFAVILNGRDEFFDSIALPTRFIATTSDPLTSMPSKIPLYGGETAAAVSPVHLVKEQLDWLSAWIFDILDCLQVMQTSSSDRTTSLCVRMLQMMCRADRTLQEAYKQRYSSSSNSSDILNNWQIPFQSSQEATMQMPELQSIMDLVWASNEEATIFSELLRF